MKTKGQIGYEAYRNHSGGVSLATGQPIPEWKDVKPEIQEAWEAAGKAISPGLDLKLFSQRNLRRCEHPAGFNHALHSWSRADWMEAAHGELGEASNFGKKMKRLEDGIPGNVGEDLDMKFLQDKFKKEIADTVIYLDLVAQREGFDLGTEIERKFNLTSMKIGYHEINLED